MDFILGAFARYTRYVCIVYLPGRQYYIRIVRRSRGNINRTPGISLKYKKRKRRALLRKNHRHLSHAQYRWVRVKEGMESFEKRYV